MDEPTTLDAAERDLLTGSLRRAMSESSGPALDAALADLGWPDLLAEVPGFAVPTVFGMLGETGAHASVLLDVLGRADVGEAAVPFAGGRWVLWSRAAEAAATSVDQDLPLSPASAGTAPSEEALARGRWALGWWLLGSGRAALALARAHVLERHQFGRPLAAFQAVRHRLAETLVALDGARATLELADAAVCGADPDAALIAALAKAAAGQAALTAARHCQQVLGGIGFTAEHDLHRHVRRILVLDGLLSSSVELTRQAGAHLRTTGSAPRLAQL